VQLLLYVPWVSTLRVTASFAKTVRVWFIFSELFP
jgi:hypothetical protein